MTDLIDSDWTALRYQAQPLGMRLVTQTTRALHTGDSSEEMDLVEVCPLSLSMSDYRPGSSDCQARIHTRCMLFADCLPSEMDLSRFGNSHRYEAIQREPIEAVTARIARVCNMAKLRDDLSAESVIMQSVMQSVREIFECWMPDHVEFAPHRDDSAYLKAKSPVSLAVLTQAVKTVTLVSDLCNSSEQFAWLFERLRQLVKNHVPSSQVDCPLHFWLNIAMTRCWAVLQISNIRLLNKQSTLPNGA
ncbi:hypothetical protein Ciccas_006659 [Cichlidogyrus casuarinus]|uniref:Uncharacterized protein n=1 Tax=Cichlidogyrus casuarinus TaxID=1844966 RepID=A0ABD2Q552_9PLAT